MAGVQGRITRDLFGQSLHILGKLVIDEKWNLYVANTFQDNAHISGTTFTNGLSEFEAEQGISVIGNVTMQNEYVLSVNNFKVTNIVGTNNNIFVKGNIIGENKICANLLCGNSITSNTITSNTITTNTITSNTIVCDLLLSDIVYSNDVYSNIIWTNTIAPLGSDEINIIGNVIASNVYCTSLQIADGGFTLGNSVVTNTIIADGAVTNSKIQIGTITGDRIASGTINSNNLSPLVDTTPVGTLLDFAGITAPAGYLVCDGSAVSTITYAALFTVIGYIYGGAGPLFNIPDFRGRFARYADNMGTGAAGRDLGARDATLAQTQSTATNGITIATDGTHTHSVPGTWNGTASAATPGTGQTNLNENLNLNFPGTTIFGGTHSHTIVEPIGAETRPINVQCYKIIKF
jgi:microcystin-dependent protein